MERFPSVKTLGFQKKITPESATYRVIRVIRGSKKINGLEIAF